MLNVECDCWRMYLRTFTSYVTYTYVRLSRTPVPVISILRSTCDMRFSSRFQFQVMAKGKHKSMPILLSFQH